MRTRSLRLGRRTLLAGALSAPAIARAQESPATLRDDGGFAAALEYVAAHGSDVVAAGTEFSAAGASRPFAEASADAGATWTQVQLPVPDIGPGTGTTVTALTAAGGGFTAVGTYGAATTTMV